MAEVARILDFVKLAQKTQAEEGTCIPRAWHNAWRYNDVRSIRSWTFKLPPNAEPSVTYAKTRLAPSWKTSSHDKQDARKCHESVYKVSATDREMRRDQILRNYRDWHLRD